MNGYHKAGSIGHLFHSFIPEATCKDKVVNGRVFLLFDSCQTYGRQLSNICPTRVERLTDTCQTTNYFSC